MKDYESDPEYLALLETLLTRPFDDAPRWVIADWIEEHDDEARAAFIRAQLNGLPDTDGSQVRYFSQHIADPLMIAGFGIPFESVERGFVRYIDMPLAQLIGECQTCEGTGDGCSGEVVELIVILKGCPRYGGTGKRLGLLEYLCDKQPITDIRVTDKKPGQPNGGKFWWFENTEYEHSWPSYLPRDVFDRLDAPIDYIDSDMQMPFKLFDTAELADAALSKAMLLILHEHRRKKGQHG